MTTIRIPLVLGSLLVSIGLASSGAFALPSVPVRGDAGLVTTIAAKADEKKPAKHAHAHKKIKKKAVKKHAPKTEPLKTAGDKQPPKKHVLKKVAKKHPAKAHAHKKDEKKT